MSDSGMRRIGVVTVARSDYGIYLPILRRIQADPDLELCLFVSGAHLVPGFGNTVELVEADGWPIAERVEMLLASDSPSGIAGSMGLGTFGFAQAFERTRPDILVVLGDRFEMHAAALAALPFVIPVAHIHGGEVTEGAIDDALRHSMTKLSHLHFTATELYARRIVQMGEAPWRVCVSGAPALDQLAQTPLLNAAGLAERFGLDLGDLGASVLLVTYHPVTLEHQSTEWQIGQLLDALAELDLPIVFTMPNADTNGRLIRRHIAAFAQTHPRAQVVENLGTQGYFSLMALAAAMVGNSSSGLIEAPSFRLPVVNIGHRQAGRLRAANVIDVGDCRDEIVAGIRRSTSASFRAGLQDLVNPYGDGHASERIVQRLKTVKLGEALVSKQFHDLDGQTSLDGPPC